METWTVDEMMSFSPCDNYSREKLEELAAGRPHLTAIEILYLDVPAEDRIWALLTKGSHVKGAVERIVTRAVQTHCLHCGVPSVEEWARKWLDGDRPPGAPWAARAEARAALAAAAEAAARAAEAGSAVEAAAEAALAAAEARTALAAALSEAEAAEAEAAAWAEARAGAEEERNRQLNDIRQAIEESEQRIRMVSVAHAAIAKAKGDA